MSDPVLSYASVSPHRPSRSATASIWAGGLGNSLFLAAIAFHYLFALPAYRAGNQVAYDWCKMWLVMVPAWSGMALALTGVVLALVGLAMPGCTRGRAIVGLGVSLALLMWMAIF